MWGAACGGQQGEQQQGQHSSSSSSKDASQALQLVLGELRLRWRRASRTRTGAALDKLWLVHSIHLCSAVASWFVGLCFVGLFDACVLIPFWAWVLVGIGRVLVGEVGV